MLRNSTILITGGTGSFGHKLIPMTLEKCNPEKIIVFSRDEMKQWKMAKLFQGDDRLRNPGSPHSCPRGWLQTCCYETNPGQFTRY